MKTRKKKILDGIDKEILRVLYKRKRLVSRQIAKSVGLTPPAIIPRLQNLKNQGLIKIEKISKNRIFERKFNNKLVKIKAPKSIFWSLDLIK
ncbi:MAG: winged helix-turn-helix transcriptional regulator [Candidatus Pacearchaeota archaeon]